MANVSNTGEFALPLVTRRSRIEADRPDRLTPATSGAAVGAGAGVVALALVHGLASGGLGAAVEHVAAVRGVPFGAALAFAYLTAGTLGAVVGGLFGKVTRYLTRWPALALWGLVFFTSVALVFVGASSAFRHGMSAELAGPIVLAGALYGLLLSVSLPIRRAR